MNIWTTRSLHLALMLAFCGLVASRAVGEQGKIPTPNAAIPPTTQTVKTWPDKFKLKTRDGYIVHIRPTGPIGDELFDDEILVYLHKKIIGRIDLPHVLEEWLKQDSYWGNHAGANQARYQHGNRNNLSGVVARIGNKGNNVEVTLEWRLRGSSWHEGEAAQLARLILKPTVKLQFIKVVNSPQH